MEACVRAEAHVRPVWIEMVPKWIVEDLEEEDVVAGPAYSLDQSLYAGSRLVGQIPHS